MKYELHTPKSSDIEPIFGIDRYNNIIYVPTPAARSSSSKSVRDQVLNKFIVRTDFLFLGWLGELILFLKPKRFISNKNALSKDLLEWMGRPVQTHPYTTGQPLPVQTWPQTRSREVPKAILTGLDLT